MLPRIIAPSLGKKMVTAGRTCARPAGRTFYSMEDQEELNELGTAPAFIYDIEYIVW